MDSRRFQAQSLKHDVARGASKVTTKDVTKQLRKKGLLGTDEDKEELKSTIGRVAKINKEGAASYVVLK